MSTAPQPPETPLESWKAIAAYLGRDARTVMRWEKFEALPVHRHRHLTRSSVYAYPRELDAWRANRRTEVPVTGRVRSGPGSRLIAAVATLAISVLSAGGGKFVGSVWAAQDDAIDRPVGWPENASMAADAAMSPDGRYVSYIDMTTRDLHVKDLQSGQDRRMTTIASAGGFVEYSAISRDGRFVAYIAKDAGRDLSSARLCIAPLTSDGPAAHDILLTGSWFEPRQWSPDDKELLVFEQSSDRKAHIALVDVAAKSIRRLQTFEERIPGFIIRMSPDGGFIAYDRLATTPERQRDIFILPAAPGAEAIPLLDGPSSDSVVGWSPDGRHLIFKSDRWGANGLWAIPIVRGKAAGEPIVVRPDFEGGMFTITSRGDLFYEREVGSGGGPPRARLLVATVSSDTGALVKAPWFAAHDRHADSRAPRWNADGRLFMYSTSRPTGPVVAIRSDNGVVREIPRRVGYVYTFDVSPDGSAIVYRGSGGIFLVDAQTGDVRRLVENVAGVNAHIHPQFTAGGKSVTYFKNEFDRGEHPGSRVYVEHDLATGRERVLHQDLRAFVANRHPMGRSPDGRYLLAAQFTSPTTLFAYDTTTGEVREIYRVNRESGLNPEGGIQWLRDSQAVVANVRAGSGSARELWWIPVDRREPRKLDIGVDNLVDGAIAIHPDGQQIAFVAGDPVISKTSAPRREFRILERFLPR